MNTPLSKLRGEITKNKLDAILISSIPNIIYLTNYSGFSKEEREAYLFITRLAEDGESRRAENKQYVLTDARYTQDVKSLIPDFKLIEISGKLSAKEALIKLAQKHEIKKIGFEGNNLTYLEYKKITSALGKMSAINLHDLRIEKTPEEINKIENACKLGDKTFEYILKEIKLGITEKELAIKIELFIKQNFADISFSPIVAFGKNSAVPHHVPNNDKLINNQIVLLDFGVKLNNYCSDMTRTVFFGKASSEFKKIYNTVAQAQQKAIGELKSPSSANKIDKIARDHIISQNYPSIPHSLGHGIGLEVHESPSLYPNSKDVLKENIVFSVEPGIYLPEFGGVRIEDLVVLEKTGARLLTHSPRNLIEI